MLSVSSLNPFCKVMLSCLFQHAVVLCQFCDVFCLQLWCVVLFNALATVMLSRCITSVIFFIAQFVCLFIYVAQFVWEAVMSFVWVCICFSSRRGAVMSSVCVYVCQHPDEKRLEGLSKQLDWDVRTIQRWFYRRRDQERPTTLARFCESM